MENNGKKAGTGAAKGAKAPSDYKSREAKGTTSQTNAAFQKAFGKAKDASRQG